MPAITDANAAFCSILLKQAREEAKAKGVKIPPLSTWRDSIGLNPYYEVWAGSEIVWQGDAHNASEAKAKAISRMIDRATGE